MAGKKLDAKRIIDTVDVLRRRIRERFPNAGLNQVCEDLLSIAQQAETRAIAIGRPMLGVRALSATVIGIVLLTFGLLVSKIRIPDQPLQAAEFVQVLEAGFNAFVLIGGTLLFLVTLETRVKRARALKAIHELRSISHIIDMHQLTKSPERILSPGQDTKSSPPLNMSEFELNRYLDYCSEMLALAGKIAALYVEDFPDAQAVAAVNDLEDLTSGLARKIWQKIMILQDATSETRPAEDESHANAASTESNTKTSPLQGAEDSLRIC